MEFILSLFRKLDYENFKKQYLLSMTFSQKSSYETLLTEARNS